MKIYSLFANIIALIVVNIVWDEIYLFRVGGSKLLQVTVFHVVSIYSS